MPIDVRSCGLGKWGLFDRNSCHDEEEKAARLDNLIGTKLKLPDWKNLKTFNYIIWNVLLFYSPSLVELS